MIERERLVELHEEAGKEWDSYIKEKLEKNEKPQKNYDEFHADYLLKYGVIVPPCKVGDTVYVVGEIDISAQEVTSITQDILKFSFHSKCIYYGVCDYRNDDPCMAEEEICKTGFTEYDIGRKIFITREEAKKALKDREMNDLSC